MFLKARTCLGVDLGDKDIKIVELRRAGKGFEVVQAARIPLGAGTDEAGTALWHFLLETDTYPTNAVCSLPDNLCSVKFAQIPKAKPTDLLRMVRFEAESQIPLPLTEMAWDASTYSQKDDAMCHAVIGAARTGEVDAVLSILDTANVNTAGVMISSLAAVRALAGQFAGPGPFVSVNVGPRWTDICVAEGRIIHSCRSIRLGDDDLTEAFAHDFRVDEEDAHRLKHTKGVSLDVKLAASEGGAESYVEKWIDELSKELRRSMVVVCANGACAKPGKVFLVGETSGIPGMGDSLGRRTGTQVAVGNPWTGMRISEVSVHTVRESAAVFAVATGLAMAGVSGDVDINLMPRHLAEKRLRIKKELAVIGGLGAVAAVLLIAAIVGQPGLTAKKSELRDVRSQVRRVQADMKRGGPSLGLEAKAVADAVNKIEGQDNDVLDLLRKLSANLPRSVWLSELSFEAGKQSILKGGALSNSAVADAVDVLSELNTFTSVNLDFSNVSASSGGQGYDFQITCTVPTAKRSSFGSAANGARGVQTRITVQ